MICKITLNWIILWHGFQNNSRSAAVSKTSRSFTPLGPNALQAVHALRLLLRTQPRSICQLESCPSAGIPRQRDNLGAFRGQNTSTVRYVGRRFHRRIPVPRFLERLRAASRPGRIPGCAHLASTASNCDILWLEKPVVRRLPNPGPRALLPHPRRLRAQDERRAEPVSL